MWAVIDLLLTGAHLAVIGFCLTGWGWSRTRRAHRWLLGGIAFSWVGLGGWYGWGYCPLTEWHWRVKLRLGEGGLPASFVKYAFDRLGGGDIDPVVVDLATAAGFLAAVGLAAVMFRRGRRAAGGSPGGQTPGRPRFVLQCAARISPWEAAMTPEAAAGLRDAYVSGLEHEIPVTRKVIAAIPEAGRDYRPDPMARTALELAQHIVTCEIQMLDEVAEGAFRMEDRFPDKPDTVAGLLALYDREIPRALARVKALGPPDLAKVVDFYGAFQLPNVVYVSFVTLHTVHHRGQLSTYLRPVGAKVPSIYGGSADDPWVP